MIEVVFLDAGETILHPHPSFPELFSSTAARRGIEVSPEAVAPVLYAAVRARRRTPARSGHTSTSRA